MSAHRNQNTLLAKAAGECHDMFAMLTIDHNWLVFSVPKQIRVGIADREQPARESELDTAVLPMRCKF